MLKVPVIAAAQINREVDKGGNGKRPTNADLKDTAALENAATLIWMLYRPTYYGITEDSDGRVYADNYADIEITKGRRYGKGRFECSFDHIKGFYPASDLPPAMAAPTTGYNAAPPAGNRLNDEDIPF